MKGIEEMANDGVGWTCCCKGEPSGEPEDSEPLSEAEDE